MASNSPIIIRADRFAASARDGEGADDRHEIPPPTRRAGTRWRLEGIVPRTPVVSPLDTQQDRAVGVTRGRAEHGADVAAHSPREAGEPLAASP